MKPKWLKAQVVKRRDATPDLFCLWLKPEGGEKLTFKPGQYCAIGLPRKNSSEVIRRPYSIVSAPHEDAIELFIELVPPPDGNLTPVLYTLAVGDSVALLQRAKGVFTFEPAYTNQVMIATVTGIAPFMSMIRDYMFQGDSRHNFFVLHGASYQDEFSYREELQNIMATQAGIINLVYVPTVSRPNEVRNKSWRDRTVRVNLIVEEYLERWRLSQVDTIVYACGHSGMVEDVKQKLTPKGWKVKEERYWK